MARHPGLSQAQEANRPRAARLFVGAGLAVALLAGAGLSFGQAPQFRNLIGLAAGGLFPAGAFNDRVRQEGVGAGIFYARRLGPSPLLLGVELSFSDYGHTSWVAYLLGLPEVAGDTSNSIFQGLAVLRIQPRTGRVTTFVEGLAGFSDLYTATAVGSDDEGETDWQLDLDDWTWAAGASAGLSILVGKRPPPAPGERFHRTFLEIKVRYLAGGRADYLKKGSFIPERSATSVITVQAGLTWLF